MDNIYNRHGALHSPNDDTGIHEKHLGWWVVGDTILKLHNLSREDGWPISGQGKTHVDTAGFSRQTTKVNLANLEREENQAEKPHIQSNVISFSDHLAQWIVVSDFHITGGVKYVRLLLLYTGPGQDFFLM